MGTLEYFQEAKLKLFRMQSIYIAERFMKTLISLIRKPCNKIQVLMNIAKTVNLIYDPSVSEIQ